MKSSVFLATCGAILAAASPILQGRRVIVKTDVVVEWVTVTVTEAHDHQDARGSFQLGFLLPASSSGFHLLPRRGDPPAPTPEPTPESSAQPEPQPAPSPDPVPVIVEDPKTSPVAAPAPQPTKVQESSPQPTDYQSAALFHHNVHRYNHTAGESNEEIALKWSGSLAASAKTLADTCVFKHDTGIDGGGYGQNLAMWGSSSSTTKSMDPSVLVARAATSGWYNGELNLFPSSEYGKASPDMSNFSKWGHYSQMVWASTKEVGCATVFCPPGTMSDKMGSWYTVCNYSPPGNMGGAYGNNVRPPLGQPGVSGP
ncbi:hypothetical protein N0V88_003391 [Collariella sp. IMI 366227]|nr:hypothetical protein N0V88_003391 [Collariella sp. IMI 366227]